MRDLNKRVETVVNKLFHGNQSAAAQDLQVSQSALSQVIAGKKNVGHKLSKAITDHPKINAQWFHSGDGAVIARFPANHLPVFDRLIPGDPQEHTAAAHGISKAVMPEKYSSTRYWHRITNDSIAFNNNDRAYAICFSLIETQPEEIQRRCVAGAEVCLDVNARETIYGVIQAGKTNGQYDVLPRVATMQQPMDGLNKRVVAGLSKVFQSWKIDNDQAEKEKAYLARLRAHVRDKCVPLSRVKNQIAGIVISKEQELE